MPEYNSKTHIATVAVAGAATQVVSGSAVLERIVVNVSSLYTVGVIDGTTGSTVNVAQIGKSATTGSYEFGCVMANGIRIITTGALTINPSITVIWRQ